MVAHLSYALLSLRSLFWHDGGLSTAAIVIVGMLPVVWLMREPEREERRAGSFYRQ